MRESCEFRLLGAVVILLATGAYGPNATACIRSCPSFSTVVGDAESIVVGVTIELDKEELDASRSILDYTFRVDEVLKGDFFKPGDKFQYRSRFERRTSCDAHPLPPLGREALLYMTHPAASQPRLLTKCGVYETPYPKLKREILVEVSPKEYLDSDDSIDVSVILRLIGTQHSEAFDPFQMRSKKPRPEPFIDRETAIGYLEWIIELDQEDTFNSALGMLGYFKPEFVRHYRRDLFYSDRCDDFRAVATPVTWADVYRPTDSCEIAMEQLIRAGDKSVVPIILKRLSDLRNRAVGPLPQFGQEKYDRRVGKCIGRLGQLGDRRAIPVLMGELESGAKIAAFGALSTFDDPRVLPALIRDFDANFNVAKVRILAKVDDPRVIPALVRALDKDTTGRLANVLSSMDDLRVVPILLSRLWKDSSAASKLEKIIDPRIAPVVRKSRYDQKRAPAILAAQGEMEDQEFMHNLIRQRCREGAIWAANAGDQSAKPLLREAFEESFCPAAYEAGYALGRLQDFDVLQTMIQTQYPMSFYTQGRSIRFVQGLLNDPPDKHYTFKIGEYIQDIKEFELRIRDQAERNSWSDWQLEHVLKLVHQLRAIDAAGKDAIANFRRKPDALPDMPDKFFREELVTVLNDQGERCREVLRTGSELDRSRILGTARSVKVNLLDHDLVMGFLTWPHPAFRHFAMDAVRDGYVTLSVADVERWTLESNHVSTSSALRFMAKNPQAEYRSIIVEVFNRGWHLFDQMLFDAIVANQVVELIDPLCGLLCEQHKEIRRRVSNTLGLLDHSSDLWPTCSATGE